MGYLGDTQCSELQVSEYGLAEPYLENKNLVMVEKDTRKT